MWVSLGGNTASIYLKGKDGKIYMSSYKKPTGTDKDQELKEVQKRIHEFFKAITGEDLSKAQDTKIIFTERLALHGNGKKGPNGEPAVKKVINGGLITADDVHENWTDGKDYSSDAYEALVRSIGGNVYSLYCPTMVQSFAPPKFDVETRQFKTAKAERATPSQARTFFNTGGLHLTIDKGSSDKYKITITCEEEHENDPETLSFIEYLNTIIDDPESYLYNKDAAKKENNNYLLDQMTPITNNTI